MAFVGVDVGTTGCKTTVYSNAGVTLAHAYTEYHILRTAAGHAELDAPAVLDAVLDCVARAVGALRQGRNPGDGTGSAGASEPLQALAVTSMGEAMVPVDASGRVLGPSLLNVDVRGSEYVAALRERLDDAQLFVRNGNTWGDQYGATKLMWLRDNNPRLYQNTRWFLNWAGMVSVALGAEPFVDYSLANRSLLFDIRSCRWSVELALICNLEVDKLPPPVAPGTIVGAVSRAAAERTGLPEGLPIVAGAHDQCANALGCGAIEAGSAMYGMGTFPTVCPVYDRIGPPEVMMELGLNVEHHAVADRFVSFIYHMGGAAVKWYRDTFAAAEHRAAQDAGRDVYPDLFAEIDARAAGGAHVEGGAGTAGGAGAQLGTASSGLLMLPYLTPMGPPDFVSDQSGMIMGLNVRTTRAQILRAIVEANAMALYRTVGRLSDAGIELSSLQAVGGGSRSDVVVQINADLFGKPLVRPRATEAGTLGAGIIGAVGVGLFGSVHEAVNRFVATERVFEPDPARHAHYRELFDFYEEARISFADLLRRFRAFGG